MFWGKRRRWCASGDRHHGRPQGRAEEEQRSALTEGGGVALVRYEDEGVGMASVDEGLVGGGSPVPGAARIANDDNNEDLSMALALSLMERTGGGGRDQYGNGGGEGGIP